MESWEDTEDECDNSCETIPHQNDRRKRTRNENLSDGQTNSKAPQQSIHPCLFPKLPLVVVLWFEWNDSNESRTSLRGKISLEHNNSTHSLLFICPYDLFFIGQPLWFWQKCSASKIWRERLAGVVSFSCNEGFSLSMECMDRGLHVLIQAKIAHSCLQLMSKEGLQCSTEMLGTGWTTPVDGLSLCQ